MYHRVAELDNDPWNLAVSPENFESQLQILQKNYKIISVPELLTNLGKKSIASRSVCITFDDGYKDNYTSAKPLLEKYASPATFFIATKYVDHQQPFWWDELEHIIQRSGKLPESLSVKIAGELFIWSASPTINTRSDLFLALWKKLRLLKHAEQQTVLEDLRSWGNFGATMDCPTPMTGKQLNELSENPLFNIGMHTATHPSLPAHPKELQLQEIVDGEHYIKDNCSNTLRVLAYPFGEFNQTTISIIKEQQLDAAFTTDNELVSRFSNPFQLGRFQVNNWNSEEFGSKILSWMQ